MGKKVSVISKQQVSDEFLDGFRACEETPKVEETAVCSEMAVDAVWQVLFCLKAHDAEEDREQCGGQSASLLDVFGDGEAARQRPIVLHLTLLSFIQLAEDGEQFEGTANARQDFPQSITADSIKGLGQVYESCMQTCVLFSAFLLYLPQHAGHVYGPSVGPEPTLAFWRVFLCYHQYEPIQQDASQDFACNGEQNDASIV